MVFWEVDLQPCKTMTNMLAPVECTNWVVSAWNSTLTTMMPLWHSCVVRTICGQLSTLCLHLGWFFYPPHPHPSPSTHPPPCNTRLKLMHTFKNHLKRLKIKQGITLTVFNSIRLQSSVLLNKSNLVQAKAIKKLNVCFSNYYQVQTWPAFAKTVTNVGVYN